MKNLLALQTTPKQIEHKHEGNKKRKDIKCWECNKEWKDSAGGDYLLANGLLSVKLNL